MLKRLDNPRVVAAIVIAVVAVCALLTPTNQFMGDVGYAYGENNYQEETPLGFFWNWVTADSISFFTFVLALVAIGQGYLIYRQINLGRNEFNATHRPEIIVHSVEAIWGIIRNSEGRKSKTVEARVTYFNKGSVPARDIEIRALILEQNERFELQHGMVTPILDQSGSSAEAGRPYTFDIHSGIAGERAVDEIGADDPYGGTTIIRSKIRVYCFGTISYADNAGVRRQTGFLWRWHQDFKWLRETESPYHYEY